MQSLRKEYISEDFYIFSDYAIAYGSMSKILRQRFPNVKRPLGDSWQDDGRYVRRETCADTGYVFILVADNPLTREQVLSYGERVLLLLKDSEKQILIVERKAHE